MLGRQLLILTLIGMLTFSEGLSLTLTTTTHQPFSSPTVSEPDELPADNPDSPGILAESSEESSAENPTSTAGQNVLNLLDCHPHTRTQVWPRPLWHSPSTPALLNLSKLLI